MAKKRPQVVVQTSSPKGVQTYVFHKSEIIFGRSGKVDLSVDEAGISREHLSIKAENGIIYIADLNSLNGAFVDGQKIAPHEFVAISENSKVSFGKCPVTLKISLPAVQAAQPVSAESAKKFRRVRI